MINLGPSSVTQIFHGRHVLEFPNVEKRDNFVSELREDVIRSRLSSIGYTCGQCAAYPCSESSSEDEPAGVCFQNVRLCRQECEYFIKEEESGRAPDFIVTGTCRRSNSQVIYNEVCGYLRED